jgi:hypothetical protein
MRWPAEATQTQTGARLFLRPPDDPNERPRTI